GGAPPPDAPARPERPELLDPREMPRRRRGGEAGRAALLHAIAHIELNAIDLHWDMAVRFADRDLPLGFFDDWVSAADDEAKHFGLLADRLAALGSSYGALPAHAGMWRAAADTKGDLLGRLAVVPMVLEARGLDVTPGMIDAFERAGDEKSAEALKVIYAEEVAHVAYGSKWFNFLCGRANEDPKPAFHALVRRYFPGGPKPPFNEEKRAEAGLPPDFYWPLAEEAAAT
ncbi:MAG: ferritin-like domain-containing protein, partial [Pseudomonadota bacterium]